MSETYSVYTIRFTSEHHEHILDLDIQSYVSAADAVKAAKRAWSDLSAFDQRRQSIIVVHDGENTDPELWRSDKREEVEQ